MEINDVVVLKVELQNEKIKRGAIGTIITVFDSPNLAYEVEFCKDNGDTISLVVLMPEEIEKI